VLGAYTRLRRALSEAPRPELAVFVDSPDLNLPLAAVAKRAGVPVLYYVAPQVWAWRPGRVRKLARRTDAVAVIFPFEAPILREAGVNARFVGHPLVDRLADFARGHSREALARELGLDPARPVLGLLPGSRHNEVERNWPVLRETARLLRESCRSCRCSSWSRRRSRPSSSRSRTGCAWCAGARTTRWPSRPV
jgi:lipid-A-disaccharide synthase